MNLHELQPESLQPTARLVFKEVAPQYAATPGSSKSDKPNDKPDDKKTDNPDSKKEADKKAPEKKEKVAPPKMSSPEIRNAARVRARQFADNPEVEEALKKMEKAEKGDDAESKKQANQAAGELMYILIKNKKEGDKSIDYWYNEAEKNVTTAGGIQAQKIYEQEEADKIDKQEQKKIDDTARYESLVKDIVTLDTNIAEEEAKLKTLNDVKKTAGDNWTKASVELHQTKLKLGDIAVAFSPIYGWQPINPLRYTEYNKLKNQVLVQEAIVKGFKKVYDDALKKQQEEKPDLEKNIENYKASKTKSVEEKDRLKESLGITGQDNSQLPPTAPKPAPGNNTIMGFDGKEKNVDDLDIDDLQFIEVKKSSS